MSKVEKQIRDKIAQILKQVKPDEFPTVYEFIQTENGYKRVENRMITMFINEDVSLSGTLMHIENEL